MRPFQWREVVREYLVKNVCAELKRASVCVREVPVCHHSAAPLRLDTTAVPSGPEGNVFEVGSYEVLVNKHNRLRSCCFGLCEKN